jgi:hypothetical protein
MNPASKSILTLVTALLLAGQAALTVPGHFTSEAGRPRAEIGLAQNPQRTVTAFRFSRLQDPVFRPPLFEPGVGRDRGVPAPVEPSGHESPRRNQ